MLAQRFCVQRDHVCLDSVVLGPGQCIRIDTIFIGRMTVAAGRSRRLCARTVRMV
jgi:hypothetical protein